MTNAERDEGAPTDNDRNDRNESPLSVDATELHRRVDELNAALHRYVDTAVGVRAVFDADTADDDPRVEAAEVLVERANSAFDSAFEETLGMVCAHTGFADDDEDEDEDTAMQDSVSLELTFEPTEIDDEFRAAIEETMTELDQLAQNLAARFEDRGITISHWACIHESYADSDEDDEDSDD